MTTNPDLDVLVQLATRVPEPVHRAVHHHCRETSRTMQAFVIEALRERIERVATAERKPRRVRAA